MQMGAASRGAGGRGACLNFPSPRRPAVSPISCIQGGENFLQPFSLAVNGFDERVFAGLFCHGVYSLRTSSSAAGF